MKARHFKRAVSIMLFAVFCILGVIDDSRIYAETSSDTVKEMEISEGSPIYLEGETISLSKQKLENWVKSLTVDDIIANYSPISLDTFEMSQISDVILDFGEDIPSAVFGTEKNYMDTEWSTSNDSDYYYYDMGYRHSGRYVSTGIGFMYKNDSAYMVINFEVDEPEWIDVNPDEVFLVDLDRYNIKMQKTSLLKYYNKLQWSYRNSTIDVSERQVDIYEDSISSLEIYNAYDKTLLSKYDLTANDDGYVYFDFGTGSSREKGRYTNLCMSTDKVTDADGNITLRFYLYKFGQEEIVPDSFPYHQKLFPIMDEASAYWSSYNSHMGNQAVISLNTVKGSSQCISEDVTYSSSSVISVVGDGYAYNSPESTTIVIYLNHDGMKTNYRELSVTTDFRVFLEKNMNSSLDDDVAYFNYFVGAGTQKFSQTLQGVLVLPNCYSVYTFMGVDTKNNKLYFSVPDEHYLGEPTTEWRGTNCKFTFPCNHSGCSYEYTSYGEVEVIEKQDATCTEDGYAIYEATCILNDSSHPDCTFAGTHKDTLRVELSATGHMAGTSQRENEVEATCTSGGSYDLVTRCVRCGEVLGSEHVDTEALGHTWNSDDWELVDESDITEDLLNNSETKVVYDKSKLDKLYIHYCARAQDAYELMVVPHECTLGDGIIENEIKPTCTNEGSYDIAFYCTECGKEIARNHYTTEALGHAGGGAVTENYVACTCTEDGGFDEVTYCTRCNEELSRNHVDLPATGHNYGDWHTVKEATTDVEGISQQECTLCGQTEQKSIAKLEGTVETTTNTTVAEEATKTEETVTTTSTSETKEEVQDTVATVKTGDTSNIWVYILLALVGGIAIGFVIFRKLDKEVLKEEE